MTLTALDIRHLRQVRTAACRGGGCAQRTTAADLAAAARAAAPHLGDEAIATRLLQLTATTADQDTASAWLIALTAAELARPILNKELNHV